MNVKKKHKNRLIAQHAKKHCFQENGIKLIKSYLKHLQIFIEISQYNVVDVIVMNKYSIVKSVNKTFVVTAFNKFMLLGYINLIK